MKIGIVTPTYHPYPGGVPEHVYHSCMELGRLGHDVEGVDIRISAPYYYHGAPTVRATNGQNYSPTLPDLRRTNGVPEDPIGLPGLPLRFRSTPPYFVIYLTLKKLLVKKK